MANLTSKEWRDLIFQNKNKEFGAYVMRKNSEKRHTLAVIFTLIGLAIIVVAVIGYSRLQDKWAKEEELRLEREKMKEMAAQAEMEEVPEEEPDDEEMYIVPELEIPEILPEEEVIASVQQTQIDITDIVENPPLSVEERKEDDRISASTTVEGDGDINEGKVAEAATVITTEPVKIEPVKVEPEPVKPTAPPKPKDEEPVRFSEQPPVFPGGEAALTSWLAQNINYPIRAQENGISGRVVIGFVVEKDGSISNIQVVKGIDKDLDAEALRVVKKMPHWNPGKNNGVPVRVFFNLPVNFVLK